MAKKPGPKTGVVADLQRVTYTVDEMTRRRLRVLGQTNESLGARVAAAVAFERYQRSTESTKRTPYPEMDGMALATWLADASGGEPTHPAAQIGRLLEGLWAERLN